MRLSEKKRGELYDAISEPVMQKRIDLQKFKEVVGIENVHSIDDLFYKLERDIWRQVGKVLDLKQI